MQHEAGSGRVNSLISTFKEQNIPVTRSLGSIIVMPLNPLDTEGLLRRIVYLNEDRGL